MFASKQLQQITKYIHSETITYSTSTLKKIKQSHIKKQDERKNLN